MRRWSRRAGYLAVILLWLVVVSLPVVAFFLATQGQIQLGDESGGVRLFMLEDNDSQGLGFQWTRGYNKSGLESAECTRTTLRYFLWEGEAAGQNVDYCQCFDAESDAALPADACVLR